MKNLFLVFRNNGHYKWEKRSSLWKDEYKSFHVDYSWICNEVDRTREYYDI